VLLDQRIDHVVDGDHALNHAVAVHDGHGDEVVFAGQPRDVLAVGVHRNRDYLLPRDG
jgi:hypothetical protein